MGFVMKYIRPILVINSIIAFFIYMLYIPKSPLYILGFHSIAINYWVIVNTTFGIAFLIFGVQITQFKRYEILLILLLLYGYLTLNVIPLLAYRAQHFPAEYQLLHFIPVFITLLSSIILGYFMFKSWHTTSFNTLKGERKEMKSRILANLSLVLSILASIYLSFLGATQGSMRLAERGMEAETSEVIIERVVTFHPILIIFILFPILGLVGIHRNNKRILWIAAVGMFLLSILWLLSYGLVFLPAAVLLLGAALFYKKEES